jgi:hypothetical protein
MGKGDFTLFARVQDLAGPDAAISLVSPVMYDDWVAQAGFVNRVADDPVTAMRLLIRALEAGELNEG